MTQASAHGLLPARAPVLWQPSCLAPAMRLWPALRRRAQIYPVTTNELDRICRRQQVQVGMAVEPFRPFVFPAVWTDEGARVTGLDTNSAGGERALTNSATVVPAHTWFVSGFISALERRT